MFELGRLDKLIAAIGKLRLGKPEWTARTGNSLPEIETLMGWDDYFNDDYLQFF